MCNTFPSGRLWLYQNRSSLMLGVSLPWKLVAGNEHFCISVSMDRIYWLAVRAQRALRALSSTHGTGPHFSPQCHQTLHQWDATALPSPAHVPASPCSLALSHTLVVSWGVPSCPSLPHSLTGVLRQALAAAVLQFYCGKADSGFSSSTVS